ncbi:MAG: prepilin-type N-terminal cleavage/methylation domain-containing protein [Candidatus Pacebacteria bacterium]|nr:prepilin-type N-terminal cleavage/methylation domain-containing protein [Candidatus Paceibacterota bacterium]
MKNLKQSFTLIEILVVVVIVALISSFIIVGVSTTTRDARDSGRRTNLDGIRKNLWVESSMGTKGYPTTPDLGSGARAWCCVGLTTVEDSNCTNLNATMAGYTLPKDPGYMAGNKEWCYMYKSDGITFDLYAKLEGKGAISLSPDKVKISNDQSCDGLSGGTWINTGLGFCVQQYEARDVGGVPTSQTGGTIWTTISQIDAIAECKSIGAHLINNAEWMALARDIESVSSNYASGILKRGNVGITDAGSYDGADPDTGNADTKAQLTLSNGQTIWHLSGNVWEWVDFTITGAGSQPQTPNYAAWTWDDFKDVTNWGNILGRENVAPKSTALDSSTGAGQVYYKSDDTGLRALRRGGFWSFNFYAGVFALALNYSPADPSSDGIGFRCAK